MKIKIVENNNSAQMTEEMIINTAKYLGLQIRSIKYMLVRLGTGGNHKHGDIVGFCKPANDDVCTWSSGEGDTFLTDIIKRCNGDADMSLHIFNTEKEILEWMIL